MTEQNYLDLLKEVLEAGNTKTVYRPEPNETLSLFGRILKYDLREGFPLLTTKRMYLKGIFYELKWILNGSTNIKYLVDNNVNIWNKDAYRWYKTKYVSKIGLPNMSYNEFIEAVKAGKQQVYTVNRNGKDSYIIDTFTYTYGDLGPVYGHQWRQQDEVDQVAKVIESIKNDPFNRSHIIDTWHAKDLPDMALKPCHILYNFGCYDEGDEKYLDLAVYQRSADMFLGVPFDLASMSLLLSFIAAVTNRKPRYFTWVGGDVHIYKEHVEQVKQQLANKPYELPKLKIKKPLNSLDDILNLEFEDIEVIGYKSHEAIKAEMISGLSIK